MVFDSVLFDLDGTLIDSAPDLGAAADKMRVDRGMPGLPFELYRPMAGTGARGMLGVAFGITPEHPEFEAMREEFFCNYEADLTARTVVFDGVMDLVAALTAQALPWGVVTNKSERFALPLSGQLPLFRDCGVLIGGDTTPHAKPHPEPLLEAARRLGVAPERCLYVGDDLRDVHAAHAAGMAAAVATYGYLGEAGDPAGWGAEFLLRTPAEVLKLVNPG
ncbi:phosphoglycolate phosphatase [Comamonas serinivorans]|uniref:phosphoglycolate phosphatase n=1 Tax=Comamonas serinivorans TaxID=1082851 RepID=A0A1Y0ERH4_9BURK|nr:phosphoglycolate phosphatase [Comamonas serinivorans]ARU06176.1 phosphoglycolate phosphatase [Comamonas serinivorans]